MRKKGLPSPRELVICRIEKLHPNSAIATLIEYNRTGMIHVSEVARKWVRDIREFLKEKQHVVCLVMRVEGDNILLSVKRVNEKDAARKLSQFNREKKAEKMLEIAAQSMKKTLDQAYEEAGYKLLEEFGSLIKSFETALSNPALLTEKGVPEKWAAALAEIAKRKLVEKEYAAKAVLNLTSYAPNGIELIRDALSSVKGFKVKYISAPKYILTGTGKSYKELRAGLTEAAEAVCKKVQQAGGEASFELIEQ